jgi:phage tail-like protein
LKRGVTHDPEFENWANLVYQSGALLGAEVSLKNFRKDIYIELLNEAGRMVSRYRVHRCWPSEYTAFPDLDANGTAVSVEQIVVENEGWERDTSVIAPQEE